MKQNSSRTMNHHSSPIFIFLLSIFVSFSAFNTVNSNVDASTFLTKHKLYKVKITSVKTDDKAKWIIKGTSKAPTGTKIYATTADKQNANYGINAAQSTKNKTWATMKHGKFSLAIDPHVLKNATNYQLNQHFKVYLFAVSKLKSSWANSNAIAPSVMHDIASKASSKKLKYTKSQSTYYQNLAAEASSKAVSASIKSSSSIAARESAESESRAASEAASRTSSEALASSQAAVAAASSSAAAQQAQSTAAVTDNNSGANVNSTDHAKWAIQNGYTWATRKGHSHIIAPGQPLPDGYYWQLP
ncbi:hypothetical protein C0V80_07815 [Leuconostoc pseudomesenteroides]|uniref:hypothetical protein n=1 Tax=Leuconostoc pseudomesenteroides TaxID=33968 RepID=UPI001E45C9BC|nr:hypothetical protein [Leuconostoc pseudomesenteroides]MCC7669466.1 hypothetical protein [Leuconostoc pseudomesenteroides]